MAKPMTMLLPAWDTHSKNAERLKNSLMPPMDQAYSALLEDLEQRGMLDETLVVWMGEFGRSPDSIRLADVTTGAMCFQLLWLAVAFREVPYTDSPTDKEHFHWTAVSSLKIFAATVYHCLGFATGTELRDRFDRPVVISNGHPISQILT